MPPILPILMAIKDVQGEWIFDHVFKEREVEPVLANILSLLPLKHAHTKTPAAWPHATFHHAVTRFLSPQAWSSTPSP